ncbi:hypothetical protein F53441_5547 [Fusarium austroafricanum]|uniref:Uncharacterized protein n=1 Tax=Fusarium austroafricanum TaxID=2364996 RepID=A0A8H4NXJ6_9HYPO|nr:hypothetical protein F53441_5547 [Fusarium austroafricanum]
MPPPFPSNSFLGASPLASRSYLPAVLTLSAKDQGSSIESPGPTTWIEKIENDFSLSTDWGGGFASHFDGQRIMPVEPIREYQLTSLPPNTGSNMYTIQVGCRTRAVKLSNCSDCIKTEVRNHRSIQAGIRIHWYTATQAFRKTKTKIYPGPCDPESGTAKTLCGTKHVSLPTICVPNFEAEILEQGAETVTKGIVTRFIRPLNGAHARALVNTFLDPSIREAALNDPDLNNVRLRVFLGEVAPPDDAKSPRLLSRPVYLDQIIHEAGECIKQWAQQMGAALAVIHWCCHLDAKGIKFYLGTGCRNRPKLWMTNFGGCQPPVSDTSQAAYDLAEIISDNPAFPRCPFPSTTKDTKDQYNHKLKIYHVFVEAYLAASRDILCLSDDQWEESALTMLVNTLDYLSLRWNSKNHTEKCQREKSNSWA